MRIGVPRGFFYYKYRPFVETFFQGLNIPVDFGKDTDQSVMEEGLISCVNEACFPVKLFHGHVKELSKRCDALVVPRIMKTEFGESVCPKVEGLPDMVASQNQKQLIFTDPLYLDDKKALKKTLWKCCKHLGVKKDTFNKSFLNGLSAQEIMEQGYDEQQYAYRVFLAGHPYLIYDTFANLNLIEKLHRMNVGIITEETVSRTKKDETLRYADLIKKPYWTFFVNTYGSIKSFDAQHLDGVIYLSSFSCGTDSFTIEMLRHNLDNIPFLVIKLDEQRGEAGIDTRLEAFYEILKRGKQS